MFPFLITWFYLLCSFLVSVQSVLDEGPKLTLEALNACLFDQNSAQAHQLATIIKTIDSFRTEHY